MVGAAQKHMHEQHMMPCLLHIYYIYFNTKSQHILGTPWVLMHAKPSSPASLHLNSEADWFSGDVLSSLPAESGLFTNKPTSSSAPVVSNTGTGTDTQIDRLSTKYVMLCFASRG